MKSVPLISNSSLLLSHPQRRDSGDFLHRVSLPGRALAQHMAVFEVQTGHPEFVRLSLEAGLLVVQMVADPVLLEVMDRRFSKGLPTVYEVSDDFQKFSPHLPGHAFYAQSETQDLIKDLAARADLLQFSSHGLCEKYGSLNMHTHVAMNQFDRVPALADLNAGRGASPVLGWAGSVGHIEDAREMALSLRAWLDARPNGSAPVPPLRIMAAESVRAGFQQAGLACQFVAPGNFDDYLAFLHSIDIGLVWISPDDFAIGRSDGKYLEYVSSGVVCVASDLGEYARTIRHRNTGYLFSDRASFIETLDAAFDHPEERLRIRGQAHARVSTQRLHSVAVLDKLAAYKRLPGMSNVWCGESAVQANDGLITLTEECEADWSHATQLHGCGLLEQALPIYLRILKKWPAFHEPWLRGAQIAQKLGAHADARHFHNTARAALQAQLQPAI